MSPIETRWSEDPQYRCRELLADHGYECYSQFTKFPILSVVSLRQWDWADHVRGKRTSCSRSRAHVNTSRPGEIPGGEFMRAKSPWYKNIRARGPRKNPLSSNDNRGYRTSIRLSRDVRALFAPPSCSRTSSICPSVRPNRIQKCRFHGKIRFAQTQWQWFMGEAEKREARWIASRKKWHADLDSPRENRGSVHRHFVLFRDRDVDVKWRLRM